MPQPSLNDLLSVAIDAAYLGGRRTLAYFNTGVAVETKSDNTPVTEADREAEQLIRRHIAARYPTHAILGEETGATPGSGGSGGGSEQVQWIIDPIDGTKTFIHGVPLYGVLIGVVVGGRPSVGVIYMPALDEMVYAAAGQGCFWNGRPARVSTVARLEDAAISTSSFSEALGRSGGFGKLVARSKVQRTWGDCYGYALVATGRLEAMVDPEMHPWDCAPMLPILEEAGGRFTTWAGQATIWGPDAVATNGLLHDEVVGILRNPPRT